MTSITAQMALRVQLRDDATFENFYTGPHVQLVESVKQLAVGTETGCIYVWGALGSGRSHLLQAACYAAREAQRSAVYISLSESKTLSSEILQDLEHSQLVCIDDVDAIAGLRYWEEALFHLYNEMKQRQHALIVAGLRPPPLSLLKLPDLVSRLLWGMVFQLHTLSDEAKLEALTLRARERGLVLDPTVGAFLLRRCPRNFSQLFQLLDKLDQASLEAKRRLTIPFVKEVLGV